MGDAVAVDRDGGWRTACRAMLAAVVIAGTALRLVLALAGPDDPARFLNVDSESYRRVAAALPGGFWSPDRTVLDYSLQRPPGYPTMLALLGAVGVDGPQGVVLVQCLIGGIVNVMLCWWLGRRWGLGVGSIVAASLLAFDPVSIGHDLQIGTETIFTTTVLGGVVVVVKLLERFQRVRDPAGAGESDDPAHARRVTRGAVVGAGLVGSVIGSAALVRPVMVFLAPLVAVGVIAVQRSRLAVVAGVALLAGSLVVTAPWLLRNRNVSGAWIFSTAQGQNLMDYGAAAAAVEDGYVPFWPVGEPAPPGDLDSARDRLVARSGITIDMGDVVERDRQWTRLGIDAIVDHPVGLAVVAARGIVRAFGGPGHTLVLTASGRSASGASAWWIRAWAGSWLGIQLVAGALGAVLLARRRARRRRLGDPAVVALCVTALYYLVMSAGPQMYSRFRVPVAPLLCLLAATGICGVWMRLGRRVDAPSPAAGASATPGTAGS